MNIDLDAFKQGQRLVWSTGDYPQMAAHIAGAAEVLLDTVGVQAGERLLDVATGAGNVAIPAAARGAEVTGLDLTPQLLEVARERSLQVGVEVDWVEGDAEALPFEDGSFERITSCFGVIFAPRHDRAAAELERVAGPGASIALSAWTPAGLTGRMFQTMGAYMPTPPPDLEPPVLWGDEEHVRSLFASSGAVLDFKRHVVEFVHASSESWVQHNEEVLGPIILARNALREQGRWDALRAELVALYEEANEARDGSMRVKAEYLVTLATMPS